jgi:hypothetical protein
MAKAGCLDSTRRLFMGEAFRLGGWGMYPTLFVGLVLLVAAGRFAFAPAKGRLAPILGLGVLVTLTSTLGFVTGIINTTTHAGDVVDPGERGGMIVVGFGESLNNIGLGLCMLVLATFGVVVGLARSKANGARGASELVDPLR